MQHGGRQRDGSRKEGMEEGERNEALIGRQPRKSVNRAGACQGSLEV